MAKIIIVICFTIFNLSLLYPETALAASSEKIEGAQIFQVHCAGCHPNGSNIIRRGKNLKSRALKRNGYDSIDAIAKLVTYGKNNMPQFKDRLSIKQIQQVATYVNKRAENNWK